MMDDISENQAISHKVERRQKYSMEFKKAIFIVFQGAKREATALNE